MSSTGKADLGTNKRNIRFRRPIGTGMVGTRTEGHWYAGGVRADNPGMTELYENQDRPVVYETRAELGPRRARLQVRGIAGVSGVVAALVAATGIAWGGSALWTALDRPARGEAPAPLWFPPPPQVTVASPGDPGAGDDNSPGDPTSSTVDNRNDSETAAPTTVTPTTVAPKTAAPTTAAPRTAAPTTVTSGTVTSGTGTRQPEPTDDGGGGGSGRSPGGPGRG